jgi:hypothetical protein
MGGAPAVDAPNERAQKLLTVCVELRHALALARDKVGQCLPWVDVRPVRVLMRIRGRLGCGFSGGGFGCALQARKVLDEIVRERWRGCRPVPGATGEYHSDNPSST